MSREAATKPPKGDKKIRSNADFVTLEGDNDSFESFSASGGDDAQDDSLETSTATDSSQDEDSDVEMSDGEEEEADSDEEDPQLEKAQQHETHQHTKQQHKTLQQQKDDTELELEKLVFGDQAGFRSAVSGFRDEEQQEQDKAIAALSNDDLFFLDSGPDVPQPSLGEIAKADYEERHPAAWHDSDDERMTVSLQSVARLRKLRTYEGEDVVTGDEYIRRLRKQFETLHPRPAWAVEAQRNADGHRDKRQRMSDDEDSDDDDAALDGDISASQTPLAKLLRNSAPLTRAPEKDSTRPPTLQPETVAMIRHKDILPKQTQAISSLSIHPTLPLLLSAGNAHTMYLHRLHLSPIPPDPPNPLLTSLEVRHTPGLKASFSPSASPPRDPIIYLSGQRKHFHAWSLPSGAVAKINRNDGPQRARVRTCEDLVPSPCGRYIGMQDAPGSGRPGGVVLVLSAATGQWVAQARVDGPGSLIAWTWWADGSGMTLATSAGEVTEWSADRRAVVSRWGDPGASSVTALALGTDPSSPFPRAAALDRRRASEAARDTMAQDGTYVGPDRFTALGLASGEVLLYERRTLKAARHKTQKVEPLRTFAQLTTRIGHVAFSACGSALVWASGATRDALRVAHVPSRTVYRNWPTQQTPLGVVGGVCWGEVWDEERRRVVRVLCVGSQRGHVRMWEVGE